MPPDCPLTFQKSEQRVRSMNFSSLRTAHLLERKTYKDMNMDFPFPARFVDQYTGWIRELLWRMHTWSIRTDGEYNERYRSKRWSARQLMQPKHGIKELEWSLLKTFFNHCNFGSYTLKFHLVNQVGKDLRASRYITCIRCQTVWAVHRDVKHPYRQTSGRWDTGMDEKVRLVGCLMDWRQTDGRRLFLKGKREPENCKLDRLLTDGAFLVCNV